MNSLILDEEVFAVILAITIVASTVAIAFTLRPETVEPFTALGLLNEECKIGDYPRTVVNGSTIDLCIFVANYMGKPVYYEVLYKIGTSENLPSNTTPSPAEPVDKWIGVLNNKQNTTFKVKIPVYTSTLNTSEVALIFELWLYDTSTSSWVYSGRWNHLYVNVTFPVGVSL